MDTSIYDLLAVASQLDVLRGRLSTRVHGMLSVMPDRLLGMLFLSVSTTMHCLCLTLATS